MQKKPLRAVHDLGKVITIREEDTFADLIGQTHKGGQFRPRQRRSARAELRLIGIVLTRQVL